MPSDREHRLHPLSILFSFGDQLRSLAVPGLLVLVGAGTSGGNWEIWALLLLIPYTLVAVVRYLGFRYRYDASEMVISTGLIFKNERHVPYARIQNIDAVQGVVHRLFGVVDVRVQTAAGQEPEAVMRVLPLAAFEQMRRRVFEERAIAGAPADAAAPAAPTAHTLLHLPVRELMLCGFIENRGVVVVAAAFGLIWEVGLFDGIVDRLFGEETTGRGLIRDLVRSIFAGGYVPIGRIALTMAAFAGLLTAVRIISMIWAVVRLYGFRLSLAADDLRSEFGLLTRVTATIPLRRIQTLTIREGPLHRLFARVSVRVETAGGSLGQSGTAEREWLAPIIRRTELVGLLEQVLPGLDFEAVTWHPVAPGAARRAITQRLLIAAPVAIGLAALGWWSLPLMALLPLWAVVHGRKYVEHLGWATGRHEVLLRTGWLWRQISVARYTKIQAVGLHESPFDRRVSMARVRVDTAGARLESGIDIPFLPLDTARQVYAALGAEAARTEFRW